MYLYFLIYAFILNVVVNEALFFLKEKPIFLCFKVCPLYCRRDSERRRDEDSSSLIYLDDEPPSFEPEFWIEDYPHPPPYYYGHWVHKITKKPKPTTPKPKTTTAPATTPEPTFICLVCEKNCGKFDGKK